ncbi:MAG: DUF434 domain-containing protein [Bacteroidia bacterium]
MSSKQRHRGQQSSDPQLFDARWIPVLNEAVADLSWLLTRGYSEPGALKLVGDRHRLNVRQRKALLRASCSDEAVHTRRERLITADALKDALLIIDGYNLLITIESALAGGIVILCRDGCYRDIASVHGTYRRVEETMPALAMIGITLQKLETGPVRWLLDKPVSNSGRLMGFMYDTADQYGFQWQVELVNNPDRQMVERAGHVAVSSDGWVLDRVPQWYNLHRHIVSAIPTAQIIALEGARSAE